MNVKKLKINLAALEPEDEEEGLCCDGLRLGPLLVSAQGVTSAVGSSCELSPADLAMVPLEEGGLLGQGSSGQVRRAVDVRTGAPVAVKEIKITSQAHVSEIRRELETLHSGKAGTSPFLVDFYGAYSYEGCVCIAMECLDGSLDDIRKPVAGPVLASITRSMLQGIAYLHRTRHLMHRDIKPSNVLFRKTSGDIKITDFGISSNLEHTKADANSFVGTITYMSPERLKGDHYSYAADVWALGLVVAELALGERPFNAIRAGGSEARFWALLQHLNSDKPVLALPDSMEPELADLITRCVAKDPAQRPWSSDLLQHPFIQKHCDTRGGAAEWAASDRAVIRDALAEPGATTTSPASAGRVHAARNGENKEDREEEEEGEEGVLNLDDELDKLIF